MRSYQALKRGLSLFFIWSFGSCTRLPIRPCYPSWSLIPCHLLLIGPSCFLWEGRASSPFAWSAGVQSLIIRYVASSTPLWMREVSFIYSIFSLHSFFPPALFPSIINLCVLFCATQLFLRVMLRGISEWRLYTSRLHPLNVAHFPSGVSIFPMLFCFPPFQRWLWCI